MSDFNPYLEVARLVAASIVGALSGAFAAHILTSGRDKASKRRVFRDFIAALDDEFASEWRDARIMDSSDFENWTMLASHYASIPRVKVEAIKVSEDIRWWKKHSFRAACDAYAHFGHEVNFEANHAKFDRIRKESHELLDRLIKCAK